VSAEDRTSVEERVRAATRARTALVRDIRPLEFPAELPAPARRTSNTRRWLGWGAPIGAAALVTALALVLVMLRQAGGPPPGPATPTAESSSSVPSSIPRYYVALAQTGSTSSQLKAVVGDDHTGRTVAVLNPSASQNFYGVTGAADDRTFVVLNYTATTKQTTWYLLRLTPGAAHPTQLTKLPSKPLAAHVAGLALSPDGRELAVMWRTATTQTNAVTYLAVYSMASGAVQHTWITKGDNINAIAGGANGEALSWVDGDRSIDFRWDVMTGGAHPSSTNTVRRIDVAAPGQDLLAGSRVAVRLPPTVAPTKTTFSAPCASSVTAGDGTVVCGTSSFSDVSFQEVCSTVPPAFVTYSGTNGKRLKVLYTYHGQCLEAQATVVWTDPAAGHVIAFLLRSEKGVKVSATDEFGLVTDGRFTPLPKLVVGLGSALDLGGLAF
jgi:hypothetical protein